LFNLLSVDTKYVSYEKKENISVNLLCQAN